MRSMEKMPSQDLNSTDRLSEFSIVIEDFDSAKNTSKDDCLTQEAPVYQRTQRPYTRQTSDATIRKILEEAEHRKHEFWKLIDEHSAVVENLKKMELENTGPICKATPEAASIRT
ncbi:hypothetical protein PPYR_01170 [Photinus pyralis]|uniref:Uncharacterized protein n=1 Tax=Photinus pyralis TaxID=7054 RepID=A0A1Y1LLJ5_PHOPY|nr:uncharacterized protein LOC116158593 [Photinus pyralis]XP_031355645.1 uncharacterized protein LOC116179962 [Photinus pyralis]KAB0804200.1 hypothetical protein PPYR_01170 [Photinus pyralis]